MPAARGRAGKEIGKHMKRLKNAVKRHRFSPMKKRGSPHRHDLKQWMQQQSHASGLSRRHDPFLGVKRVMARRFGFW